MSGRGSIATMLGMTVAVTRADAAISDNRGDLRPM